MMILQNHDLTHPRDEDASIRSVDSFPRADSTVSEHTAADLGPSSRLASTPAPVRSQHGPRQPLPTASAASASSASTASSMSLGQRPRHVPAPLSLSAYASSMHQHIQKLMDAAPLSPPPPANIHVAGPMNDRFTHSLDETPREPHQDHLRQG